ncbi:MAG: helix-turn-helix domain-containing protein [Chthoniobacterales bacterium]|nr:helix-turn-helix domain-containing protein [Chthoniobacterales bacterium]
MSANLITKQQAAEMIGGEKPVSVSFINQLLARRKLPKVRLSYKVCRIPRAAVEAFIASRTEIAK